MLIWFTAIIYKWVKKSRVVRIVLEMVRMVLVRNGSGSLRSAPFPYLTEEPISQPQQFGKLKIKQFKSVIYQKHVKCCKYIASISYFLCKM
jgi:hypothetical protein